MRRNFSNILLDLSDKQLKTPDGSEPLTLGWVATNALLADYPDERGTLDAKEKVERFHLALRIRQTPGDLDIGIEELALLKLLIGKAFTPLVVERAYEMLEQEPRAVAA